jgi:hypothetical protein
VKELEIRHSERAFADRAGMAASIACAIHCAAMPIAIGYLPLLGLEWLANESFHRVMALVCFGLAVAAFVPGWRRHGSVMPAILGGVGIASLALAAFGLGGECCASCTVPSPRVVGDCGDSTCAVCLSQEVPKPPTALSSLLGTSAPLLTPLGGVLLVAGHLLNRRKSCACRDGECCLGGVAT